MFSERLHSAKNSHERSGLSVAFHRSPHLAGAGSGKTRSLQKRLQATTLAIATTRETQRTASEVNPNLYLGFRV